MSALYEAMMKSKNRKARRKQIALSVLEFTAGAVLLILCGWAAGHIVGALLMIFSL